MHADAANAAEPAGPVVWIELAAAVLALLLLFAVVPHAITGDGMVRYTNLNTLLTRGELPEQRYSYIGPLFASPLWLRSPRTRRLWWAERFNVLLLAAGASAAWILLRRAASPRVRASFVLLLVAAGMMPNHVRDFYGEVFTAVCVAIGLAAVLAADLRAGWVLVVLGAANTPAALGGLVPVAAWHWWRTKRYDGAAAVLAAAAIVLIENTVVRGGPFETGYAGDHGARTLLPFSARGGFSYPRLLGVLSLLFSFGKGLLFFAPGLAFVPWARREASPGTVQTLDAWMIFLGGLVAVYGGWWAWYGGWYWGPRFLLIAVFPSALALALLLVSPAPPARRVMTAAAVLWTVWVGVSGAVFGNDGLDVCMADSYALEHLCWYVPEFSPLFRPLVITPRALVPWQTVWMVFAAVVAALLASVPFARDDNAPPENGR